MTEVTLDRIAALVTPQMHRGVFLCVDGGASGAAPNVMTIAWGGLSYFWGKDMFIAPVRPQRHTHSLLERAGAFSVCVPAAGTMEAELQKAGTLSGRDGDKFLAIGLQTASARTVAAPVMRGCALYLECAVLAHTKFTAQGTAASIISSDYKAGDFHTLFFGEITACYTGDML